MNRPLIAPSILSADFARLADEVNMLNESGADLIHCDIMDGVYVPNITFGFGTLKAVKRHAALPLDVHLMIMQPERYVQAFVEAGADIITFHPEACIHVHRTLEAIKSYGIRAGLAINPATPLTVAADVLYLCDVICVMSVNPGFAAQKFIPQTIKRVQTLKAMIDAEAAPTLIEVDGGVTFDNAASLWQAGVDILVAGNTVFTHPNPAEAVRRLKEADLGYGKETSAPVM